jgi:hypothetical protein
VDGYLPVLVGEIVRVGWGSCGVGDVYVKWVSREVRTGTLLPGEKCRWLRVTC